MGFPVTSLVYGVLAVLSIASRQRTLFGFAAIGACTITALWAWCHHSGMTGWPLATLESLRLVAWTSLPGLLMRQRGMAGIGAAGADSIHPAHSADSTTTTTAAADDASRRALQVALVLLAVLVPLYGATLAADSTLQRVLASQLLPATWLGLALAGLVQLERLYRQTDPQRRRAISLLCLSLGALLAVDFLFFTDALLFRRTDPFFLGLRGWASAALAIPIAVALARTPGRAMQLHVSRHAATASSAVLLAAGSYLLLVAIAGYALRLFDIGADGPLEIVFGVLVACVLAALVAWPSLRRWLRVTLAKHLFSYKYDYRQEWLSFTATLADDHLTTPKAILSGLCGIVDSPTGALWTRDGSGRLSLLAEHNLSRSGRVTPASLVPLQRFMERTRWLVDLDEVRRHPQRYTGLSLPDTLIDDPAAWLLVPLPRPDALLGVALVGRSPMFRRIDWEDRDLLKAAGLQGAGQLTLFLATEQLAESREFDAFNRTSAYVMHDLKNILGQQTLIVANAERHRHKPAFMDDVIETIEHSVVRMNALLRQLEQRHGDAESDDAAAVSPIDLVALVGEVCRRRAGFRPVPVFDPGNATPASDTFDPGDPGDPVLVRVDGRGLARIAGHLVQNAQEASDGDGSVRVRLERDGDRIALLVQDEGVGMSDAFVRERLFRPFDSTKGLTGMGIGVFEAREVARLAGGDLVEANPAAV